MKLKPIRLENVWNQKNNCRWATMINITSTIKEQADGIKHDVWMRGLPLRDVGWYLPFRSIRSQEFWNDKSGWKHIYIICTWRAWSQNHPDTSLPDSPGSEQAKRACEWCVKTSIIYVDVSHPNLTAVFWSKSQVRYEIEESCEVGMVHR